MKAPRKAEPTTVAAPTKRACCAWNEPRAAPSSWPVASETMAEVALEARESAPESRDVAPSPIAEVALEARDVMSSPRDAPLEVTTSTPSPTALVTSPKMLVAPSATAEVIMSPRSNVQLGQVA